MKKHDIVNYVAEKAKLTHEQAIAATDSVIGAISNSLAKEESVFLRGFATIKAVRTAPKKARNIALGTEITVPARRTAKLVLSKELKQLMNIEQGIKTNS